jgi:multidrug transporter EmrE-like cation transporter
MIGYWLALAGAISTSVAGQALLKGGAGAGDFVTQLLDRRTILGLVLYGGAALLYIVALRRIPVSVALPFTAASYIAGAAIGFYVFGETLTPLHLVALVVILVGVVLLAIASAGA